MSDYNFNVGLVDELTMLRKTIKAATITTVAARIQADSIKQGDFKNDRTSALEALDLWDVAYNLERSDK